MDVILVILGVFAVAVIVGIYAHSSLNKQATTLLQSIPNFSASWHCLEDDVLVAIDAERLEIVIGRVGTTREQRVRRFSHRDILSVEIIEDGATVTQTNRSSQLGGALIGGLAFGGVGALAGALTGGHRTTQKVKNLELRILVNSLVSPLLIVKFLTFETTVGGTIHKDARNRARELQGRIEVLIRKADQEDVASERSIEKSTLSQELERLAALQKSGALTEQEFAVAKRALLDHDTEAKNPALGRPNTGRATKSQ